MSSNIPSAPDAAGANKKDHTAIIVVIVVIVGVFIIPLIIGAIIVFGVLGFIGDHIDEIDINGIIHGFEYLEDEGVLMTHNESVAVRNVVSQLENFADKDRTISKRDCQYLERIANYYIGKYDDKAPVTAPSFCSGESVYGSVTYSAKETTTSINSYGGGQYELFISDGTTCVKFYFNGALNAYNGFATDKSLCNTDKMTKMQIVNTGESLEPVEKKEDDEEDAKKASIRV